MLTRKNTSPKYEIKVKTNIHLAIEDNSRVLPIYYYATPYELSTDTLQWAIDNNQINTTKDGYIQFDRLMPSLLVEKSTAEFKDTRRNEFADVYEGGEVPLISREENMQNYSLETPIFKTRIKYGDGIQYHSQNIAYVKNIAESLTSNIPKCDIAGIPEQYIIKESIYIDGVEYVIVGYPDPKKMRQHLDLLRPFVVKKSLKEIHQDQQTNTLELFKHLINTKMQSPKYIASDSEIYKMVGESLNKKYIDAWYSANSKIPNPEDKLSDEELESYKQLKPSLDNDYNQYVNDILQEYLNKPMTRIRYVFLIFIRSADGNHVPAFFNLKELQPQHKPILEKVLELIQFRIPQIFGILNNSPNELSSYKLFHSYMKYGDFFHITTEYLHTMSNISHYAYVYENSISLEEIIYACGRISTRTHQPFLSEVKLEYNIRIDRIYKKSEQEIPVQHTKNRSHRNISHKNRNTRNRSTTKKKSNIVNGSFIFIPGTKIILMYERNYAEYVIILKLRSGAIKQIIIKSNLSNIAENVIDIVSKMNDITPIYKCGNDEFLLVKHPINIFRIVEIKDFTESDYKKLLYANPLCYNTLQRRSYEQYVPFKYYFENELLKMKSEGKPIINLFAKLPILTTNQINNPIYEYAVEEYKKGNRKPIISVNNIENSGRTKIKTVSLNERNIVATQYENYIPINVMVNPENCGYNIIIQSKDNIKFVYWIIPYDSSSSNIRNCLDLNGNHAKLLNILLTHKPIANQLLNSSNKILRYFHNLNSAKFFTLHMHYHNDDDYTRSIPDEEKGSRFIRDIPVNKLYNNIMTDSNYYNDIDFNVISIMLNSN